MSARNSIYFIFLIILLTGGCTAMKPKNLGVTDGKLKECPDSPNCISTQSSDPVHHMDPIVYRGDDKEAFDRIIKVINSMDRTKIITKTDNYIHAEYTTKLMRFVDDVEFYFDFKNKTIHFRSASRVGYSDMGLNRKRMNEVTAIFKSLGTAK
jgi:uncharacterized protein (DUF1499 family)